MAPWVPFLLLPLYFGGLAAAIFWLAPRLPDAEVPQVPPAHPDTDSAQGATAQATQTTPPATPGRISTPLAQRERPKRANAIGIVLFACYWVAMVGVAWWQARHGRV